jgi:hypothetical protein
MVDQKIKKILIFGMPRTGTTLLQFTLAHKIFKVTNWNEPFNSPGCVIINNQPLNLDPYKWVSTVEQGVIKLLAQNLNYVDYEKIINVGNFDCVVFTERQNLVDCCLSLLYAELKTQYHYKSIDQVKIEKFKADEQQVQHWCRAYQNYVKVKNYVVNQHVPWNLVQYEDFIEGHPQSIAGHTVISDPEKLISWPKFIATNIPYQEMCTNIQSVKKIINEQIYSN